MPPRGSRPHLGTHPDIPPFRVRNGTPGRGMIYTSNLPSTPFAEIKEALMGFRVRYTDARGLSTLQKIHLFGQFTDLNSIAWTKSTIRTYTSSKEPSSSTERSLTTRASGYTSSQAIPCMEDVFGLPYLETTPFPSVPTPPPMPHQWTPMFTPEN